MKSRGYAEVSEDLQLSFLRDFLKCGKITSSMGDDAINGSGSFDYFWLAYHQLRLANNQISGTSREIPQKNKNKGVETFLQSKAAFETVKRGYTDGMRVNSFKNNAAMQKRGKPGKEECKMASGTKVSLSYEHQDGSKETRSISNVNPEATNETLLGMANKFMGLQDEGVKSLVGAKRIDTTDLM